MTTYSATEVISLLGGTITYRQLDYWCRYGAIAIIDDSHGSGTRRRFSDLEVGALRELVAHYNRLNEELEDIRDGKAWAQILRRHQRDAHLAEAV